MSIQKLILAVAFIAIAGVTASYAQPCSTIVIPEQTRVNCIIVNGVKVYVDDLGNVYNLTSNGNGTFTATSSSQSPCTQNLNATAISATGNDPVLGTVTTTLDATRPGNVASIRSNQADAQFPATADLSFYANATISSRPGVVYRSIQPLRLRATVNSFNPFRGEAFRIAAPVSFEDVRRPGQVAFRLSNLTVTLN